VSEVECAVGPAERTPVPAARSMRRYNAAVARKHAHGGVTALLSDVYYSVVIVGIAVLMAIGALGQLPVHEPPVGTSHATSLAGLTAVAYLALAGALIGSAGRLGPVGAGGAEATWWLPLPVDRRGLLRPNALRMVALGGVASAVVATVLAFAVPGGTSPGRSVAGVAVAGVAAVVVAGLLQVWTAARVAVRLGDLLLAAAPVAAAAAVLGSWQPESVLAVPWWGIGLLGAVAVGGAFALDALLGRIPARRLRESGAVAAQATGALVSLDTRELGRALGDRLARQQRRRSLRMRLVGGPVRALVVADALVLARSPRHLGQILVTALVPALVLATPDLTGSVQLALAFLVAGSFAMLATGEASRRAEMSPGVDRLLPMGATATRRARLIVPGVVMTLWTLVALGSVGLWRADPLPWLALAVLAGPAWAGGALRSAFRPAPKWDSALVSTPAGAVPLGAAAVLARGPDVVVLGLLPATIAVLAGSVPQTLLLVQAVATAVALRWGSSTETRTLMDRLAEAQEAAGEARK